MTTSKNRSKSKQEKFLTVVMYIFFLSPAWCWLYDHGMLPSFPRSMDGIIIGWFPAALPLYTDYIENPIWQLHGVYGWGEWFRSYYFTCEFKTREKVLLKEPGSWTIGTAANIEKLLPHADDFLPPDLIQGIKKSDFEYWFRDTYPHETTVLFHKNGSDHYSLFSAGAS